MKWRNLISFLSVMTNGNFKNKSLKIQLNTNSKNLPPEIFLTFHPSVKGLKHLEMNNPFIKELNKNTNTQEFEKVQ